MSYTEILLTITITATKFMDFRLRTSVLKGVNP